MQLLLVMLEEFSWAGMVQSSLQRWTQHWPQCEGQLVLKTTDSRSLAASQPVSALLRQ